MRILIADDDPIHRKLLYSTLVKWGHQVTLASDGNEAWAILQCEEAPRLAILDWSMPGMDGLEVCRAVRQLDKLYVFIILLTASDRR